MIKPIIHLNGTSGSELADGYFKARNAVRDAISAFSKMEFNARDYYVHPLPGAWDQAVKEQRARVEKLSEVADELLELAMYCQDQVDQREARKTARMAMP